MSSLPGSTPPPGGSIGGLYPGSTPPGGGGLSGPGSVLSLPGATPPELRQKPLTTLPEFAPGDNSAFSVAINHDKYVDQYVTNLINLGVPREAAYSAAEIAFQRKVQNIKRPSTFLNVVGKVLNAPAEAVAGFTAGIFKSAQHTNNPWDQLTAAVHETGTALHQNKMAGDYLFPGNPYLGFGASTLFDPVMYISFGATAPSKLAARQLLAFTTKQAMERADKILAEKEGWFWGEKFNDKLSLTQKIRQAEGMPMTMAEALDQIHGTGMEAKALFRRFQSAPVAEGTQQPTSALKLIGGAIIGKPQPLYKDVTELSPTLGRVAGSYLLPTSVRGGRGIRFAGMQIPGTGKAGEFLGRYGRDTAAQKVFGEKNPLVKAWGQGFLTDPELRLLGEDTVRALALTEMAAFKAELQGARIGAIDVARGIARGGTEKYIGQQDRAGAHLDAPILDVGQAPRLTLNPKEEQGFAKTLQTGIPNNPVQGGKYYAHLDIATLGEQAAQEIRRPKKDPLFSMKISYEGLIAKDEADWRLLQKFPEGGQATTQTPFGEGLQFLSADEASRIRMNFLRRGIKSEKDIRRFWKARRDESARLRAHWEQTGELAPNAVTKLPKYKSPNVPELPFDVKPRYGYSDQGIPKEAFAEGTDQLGNPIRHGFEQVTPEEMAQYPDLRFFPVVVVHKEGPLQGKILIGSPMSDHASSFERWLEKNNLSWNDVYEGTGVLGDNGLPSHVNIYGEARHINEYDLPLAIKKKFKLTNPQKAGYAAVPQGYTRLYLSEGGNFTDDVFEARRFNKKMEYVDVPTQVADHYKTQMITRANQLSASEEKDMADRALAAANQRFTEAEQKRIVWKPKPETPPEPAPAQGLPNTPKATISKQIADRVDAEIEAAKSLKLSARETRELWDTIAASTNDPIEAIGMFVFQNQVKVRSREFIKRILDNPMFATPIEKEAKVPVGYKPFVSPIDRQRYAVLGDMANALDDLSNPIFLDRSTSAVMKALQMPQNYWKQFATSANPSFHVMNFLGAVWNNLYAGIYNPGDYVRALTLLYRARMEEAVQSGATRYMGRQALSTDLTKGAHEMFQEARKSGASAETASIFAEIQQGLERNPGDQFVRSAPVPMSERVKDVVRPRPNESNKRYALRQTRRGTAIGFLAHGNPVGVALLAPEAAQVGRVLGTTIEDIVRLAPFMKASHDPVLMRTLDAFGPIRVPGNRHPTFSKELQKAQYAIGAEISKHFQFDYSDLTDFERRWAKLVFPFYTFYKKNFVLQLQLLAQAPRGVHSAQAVMNYLNQNGDVSKPMQQLLPEYFDQISAFQVPMPQSLRRRLGLSLTEPLYLNPKLPFVSLNLMPDLWDVFRDTGQPTPQKVLGAFAPMLGSIGPFAPLPLPGMKTFIEAVVGETLGLNKTLDYQRSSSNDYRNSYVPAPSWVQHLPGPVRDFMGIFPWMKTTKGPHGNYLMTATGQYILDQMATPFVTNLGQVIPTGGQDAGKSKADMVSWLTGVRLIPVDMLRMHRSWAYRLKSMLEARQSDLHDQGLELDPTDAETLQIVRQQVKVLEDVWDIRQNELYGTTGGK